MEISPRVLTLLQEAQDNTRQITLHIGQLEVRKLELLKEIERISTHTHKLLEAEALRLGIPDGTAWNITPSGEVQIQDE